MGATGISKSSPDTQPRKGTAEQWEHKYKGTET